MVDEANAYVDPDTGLEEAVPATTDWLAEWTLKAIATIATDSVRRERLPDKDPGWRAEHEERLALIAKLAALGERRLPVVMTLLGWPDAKAVEAMAIAEQPTRLTVDRYRALAKDGMRRLVEGLDPAWAGSVEGQLAGLRWRVQSVMAPLVWHPESTHLVVDEADFADLLGRDATEAAAPPFAVGGDLTVDQQGDDGAMPAGEAIMDPDAADDIAPARTNHETDSPTQEVASGAWWADDVVPLDGEETEPAKAPVAVATSGRRSAVRDGVRRRVLAAGGVASVLAAVVGIVALSG